MSTGTRDCLCWWNPESWALKSRIQPEESGIPLTIRIRNPNSIHKGNPESTGRTRVQDNLRLRVVPIFLRDSRASETRARLFSRGVIFTRARVSLALLSLRKNGTTGRLRLSWTTLNGVLRQINTLVNINHFIEKPIDCCLTLNNKISVRRLRNLTLGQWVSTPKGRQFHLLCIFLLARLFKHRFFSV